MRFHIYIYIYFSVCFFTLSTEANEDSVLSTDFFFPLENILYYTDFIYYYKLVFVLAMFNIGEMRGRKVFSAPLSCGYMVCTFPPHSSGNWVCFLNHFKLRVSRSVFLNVDNF